MEAKVRARNTSRNMGGTRLGPGKRRVERDPPDGQKVAKRDGRLVSMGPNAPLLYGERRARPARGSVAAETRTHAGSYLLVGVRFSIVRRVDECEHTKETYGSGLGNRLRRNPENEMKSTRK